MEISGCSSFAAAPVAIAAAFFVFVLAAGALAFAALAIFAAGRDVGARGALLKALIETQWRANEIESGAQSIFEEALIAEVERLQLICEKNECGRSDCSLCDVEDFHFAVGW
jgi:hypothetical protein